MNKNNILNVDLDYIGDLLKERSKQQEWFGNCLNDLGNEIGFIIGTINPNSTQEDIKDFINGFKHGISLTNETH